MHGRCTYHRNCQDSFALRLVHEIIRRSIFGSFRETLSFHTLCLRRTIMFEIWKVKDVEKRSKGPMYWKQCDQSISNRFWCCVCFGSLKGKSEEATMPCARLHSHPAGVFSAGPCVQDLYTRLLSANLDFDSELQHVFWWEPDECRDSRVFHVDRVFLRLC